MNEKVKKSSLIDKFLNVVEKGGNALPHPGTLFAIFALAVILVSAIGAALDWSVTYTAIQRKGLEVTGSAEVTTSVFSLLSRDGVSYIFSSMITNFAHFAPLGTVLVAVIGVSVCERSGLMTAITKKIVLNTPKRFITVVVVFLGIMSNIASDTGYVILPPLAAIIFISFGKHPIAGLAAAFAGVSGGYSANLLIGTLDPLLAGISTEAANILADGYEVLPTANYFFMIVSTFVIAAVGTFITEKIVEPRLGEYKGANTESDLLTGEDVAEAKGLRWAGFSLIPLFIFYVIVYLTIGGKLFFGGALVPLIVFFFAVPGIAYGVAAKSITNDSDVMRMITESLATMGGYITLTFFAAQFINYFNKSNLGTILAVKGADFLKATGFSGVPLILTFVLVVCFLNLFMGSASAKWAILAPVFIPMFMEIGYTPEFTQLSYRIGDSVTNIISPLMSYFAVIVVYMQKYDKKASIGTLTATMLPYSMAFLVVWSALLAVWMLLGLPIGPSGALMTM